jgi:hypothetical protein
MTIQPLDLTFIDGQTVPASSLNAMVTTINSLISANNSITALLNQISKSEILVIANKATTKTFTGNGVANPIDGWMTTLNKAIAFNAASGVFIVPETGTYTIIAKTLVSGTNANAPRSKLWISANGQEVGLSEDTVFQQSSTIVQNYRRDHDANATLALTKNAVVFLMIQVWGAATASIFGDQNTVIKIYREIS